MAGRRARSRRAVDRAPDAAVARALRGDLRDARARARRRGLADESARAAPSPAPRLRLLLGHAREMPLHPRVARRDRRVPAAADHAPDAGRADRHERAHDKKRRGPRAQSHAGMPRRGTRLHAPRRARRRKARAGVRGDADRVEEPGLRPGVDAHPCRIARLEKPAAQRDRVRQRRGAFGTARAAGQGIPFLNGELFPGFKRRRIRTSGAAINLVHGGVGPPLLLLHGYPQTHAIWHRVAPELAKRFRVVAADLRGYGDSEKPHGLPDHANYSKRAMAQDQVEAMRALGHETFFVVGHDRGGRVAHRMALDHARSVEKIAVLDIVPTRKMYTSVSREFAKAYYHWFFLLRPEPIPETLIGANPDFYIESHMGTRHAGLKAFAPEALAEYRRCFRDPATIHASCADYRAAESIDLAHDEADIDRKVVAPLLVLWGKHGTVARCFSPLEIGRASCRERV